MTTLRIAWRNLGRNRRRTLLAMGAIALGQTTLVFINGMMAGWYADMLDTITGPLVGHVQVHHPEWRTERAMEFCIEDRARACRELTGLPHVASVSPRIYAPVLAAYGEKTDPPADAEPGMIVGVDMAVEASRGGILENVAATNLPGKGSVAVGRILANRVGVRAGDLLAVIGQDRDGFPMSDLFRVSAVVDTGVDVVKTLGIVMPLADAGELGAMTDEAHEIVVQADDHAYAGPLSTNAAALPSLAGMEVLTWKEAAPSLATMMAMKDWMDLIFVVIVFLAAAAGIANTSTMSSFERTHEFGMLLAVGTRPSRVVNMVLLESVLLGVLGVIIGSAVGTALVVVTGRTGINYAGLTGGEVDGVAYAGLNISYMMYPKFELRHVVFGFCAVILTSVLASLWPACLAARLHPVEAMRS